MACCVISMYLPQIEAGTVRMMISFGLKRRRIHDEHLQAMISISASITLAVVRENSREFKNGDEILPLEHCKRGTVASQ